MDITLGMFKNISTCHQMKDTDQGADLNRYFGPVVSSLEQIIAQVRIVQTKSTERAANKNSSNKDNKPCSW